MAQEPAPMTAKALREALAPYEDLPDADVRAVGFMCCTDRGVRHLIWAVGADDDGTPWPHPVVMPLPTTHDDPA